jgi:hypothetical protein
MKFSSTVLGVLAAAVAAQSSVVDIYDDSIKAGETKTWSASNTYIMHGKVCVEDGARLYIEAGSKVLADGNDMEDATVLVICRGGRIYAQGTAEKPIIFTSVFDTMTTPLPLTNDARGLWGGIDILGRAPLNEAGGVGIIEDLTFSDSAKFRYGDSTAANPNDTSGVLQYVSIRHPGISDQAQIVGLFLGAVGKGTKIDHIESFMGAEDGISLTGGTVDIKYFVSAFQAGEVFFAQQGYQGRVQYLFGIQNVVEGSAVNGCMAKLESNGVTKNPLTLPIVYNATLIGTGINNPDTWKYKYGIYFKKNGGGTFTNSILTQCSNYGIYVEDKGALGTAADTASCRARLDEGSIVLKHNVIYGFGKGNTIDSISMGLPFLQNYLTADSNKNDFVDPQINGFSWTPEGKLDPRPASGSPVMSNVATVPNDGFFDQTTYRGAFDPATSLWAAGWSALSTMGIFDAAAVPVVRSLRSAGSRAAGFSIENFGDVHRISWSQPVARNVTVSLHTVNGKTVRVLDSRSRTAGNQQFSFSTKNLSAGVYIVRLQSAATVMTGLVRK